MPRVVRNTAFCLLAAIPLLLILFVAVGLDDRDLAVFDALFWRVAAVILLFLLWRGVLALEAINRRSAAATEPPETPLTPPATR